MNCAVVLNRARHATDEICSQFSSGVDEAEFWIGMTTLGIVVTDTMASQLFDAECLRVGAEKLTVRQFLLWFCRHAGVAALEQAKQQQQRTRAATEQLDAVVADSQYGDVFFSDLANAVFTTGSETASLHEQQSSHGIARLGRQVVDRANLLREGIGHCLRRHDSFPEVPKAVLRELVLAAEGGVYFTGQNIATQGRLEEEFYVLRRGAADIIVDQQRVGTVRAGEGFGEMALFYGTRRPATLRAAGPTEVFSVNRAAYQAAVSSLPESLRNGPLIVVMTKIWDVVCLKSGNTVDYRLFLEYHLRVSKVLTNAEGSEGFSEDEQREICKMVILSRFVALFVSLILKVSLLQAASTGRRTRVGTT